MKEGWDRAAFVKAVEADDPVAMSATGPPDYLDPFLGLGVEVYDNTLSYTYDAGARACFSWLLKSGVPAARAAVEMGRAGDPRLGKDDFALLCAEERDYLVQTFEEMAAPPPQGGGGLNATEKRYLAAARGDGPA
jgi:hypothetical protein